MCKIIHIESATDVCSVSISDGGVIIARKEVLEDRSHAVVMAANINDLLKEQNLTPDQLNAVSVSMGPGSYTGLRIGVSIAKGICYGADLPLIAVPTLESMTWGLVDKMKDDMPFNANSLLIPMIDARRMEVYTSYFSPNLECIKETHALIVEPDTFKKLLREKELYFFGNGADKLTDILSHVKAHYIPKFKLSSVFQSQLAFQRFKEEKFEDLAYFEPYYLKDFITTTPKKKILP